MSEISGDEKEGEVTAETNSGDSKEKPDVGAAVRRMLSGGLPKGTKEDDDSAE